MRNVLTHLLASEPLGTLGNHFPVLIFGFVCGAGNLFLSLGDVPVIGFG